MRKFDIKCVTFKPDRKRPVKKASGGATEKRFHFPSRHNHVVTYSSTLPGLCLSTLYNPFNLDVCLLEKLDVFTVKSYRHTGVNFYIATFPLTVFKIGMINALKCFLVPPKTLEHKVTYTIWERKMATQADINWFFMVLHVAVAVLPFLRLQAAELWF